MLLHYMYVRVYRRSNSRRSSPNYGVSNTTASYLYVPRRAGRAELFCQTQTDTTVPLKIHLHETFYLCFFSCKEPT
jgi:hypothetical protein